jgi:hypothetical protein
MGDQDPIGDIPEQIRRETMRSPWHHSPGRAANRWRGGHRSAFAARPCTTIGVGKRSHHEAGICEPEDVIANRLDPWHGSWFHPYAFSHLVVDDDASSDQAR